MSGRATASGKSVGAVFPNATAVLREASTAVGRIGNPSYLRAECDCPAMSDQRFDLIGDCHAAVLQIRKTGERNYRPRSRKWTMS